MLSRYRTMPRLISTLSAILFVGHAASFAEARIAIGWKGPYFPPNGERDSSSLYSSRSMENFRMQETKS